jgi:hypothetical protein
MRAFARPFPLAQLSLEARVLYSAFLLFVFIGIGTSAWLGADSGLTHQASVQRYYVGGPAVVDANTNTNTNTNTNPAGSGPALELAPIPLPDDPPKSARQVVETFHFHVFTMPVLLLIIGHIFFMTRVPPRLKVHTLVWASLSTLLHLLVPPVTRFVSAAASHLFVPTAVVMTVTWMVMCVVPAWQMWTHKPEEN